MIVNQKEFRIAVATFDMESWPVVVVRTPARVCAPRDPSPSLRPPSSRRARPAFKLRRVEVMEMLIL